MSGEKTKPPATLSLDLDNLWAYLRTQGDASWRDYPSFLPLLVPRIVSFFERLELPITIFVVGRDITLPAHEKLIASLSKARHELANHSFDHALDFHRASTTDVSNEIEATEQLIRDISGEAVYGFRGPSFRLSKTILEILMQRGYRYDASTFPTVAGPLARTYFRLHANLNKESKAKTNDLFGSISDGTRPLSAYSWVVSGGTIIELPVTTFPLLRLPIHLTYINALADISPLIAQQYFISALTICRARDIAPSLLLHATDFLGADDSMCPRFLPGMRRTSDDKIELLRKLLERYKNDFRVTGLAAFANNLTGQDVPIKSYSANY